MYHKLFQDWQWVFLWRLLEPGMTDPAESSGLLSRVRIVPCHTMLRRLVKADLHSSPVRSAFEPFTPILNTIANQTNGLDLFQLPLPPRAADGWLLMFWRPSLPAFQCC